MILSPSDLKFLASATANPKARPTLAFAFYNATTKKIASTDTFRLHEISADLGDKDFWIDKNGGTIQQDTKFPAYENFFRDCTLDEIHETKVNLSFLKFMRQETKNNKNKVYIDLQTGVIKSPSYEVEKKNSKLPTFSLPVFSRTNYNEGLENLEVALDISYLSDAIQDQESISFSLETILSPFQMAYSNRRALIMPLKI